MSTLNEYGVEGLDVDGLRSPSFIHRATTESEQHVLEWRNIYYSVEIGKGKSATRKEVLKGISGAAKSGQLLAILGPTGSGKTSFMNALAGRVPTSKNASLTGLVLVDGKPRILRDFKRISAYVLQDDVLFPHLTVFETFLYATHFFLPSSLTLVEKKAVVNEVIAELGLMNCQNTIIGGGFVRGVSGGERKRVNIGIELISDPSILFLDEPTSGLDSFQAQSVMQAMRRMSKNGRLVTSIIHQPRSSIYQMFDQLLLLSEGHTMYIGPASSAFDFYSQAGFPVPQYYNPADFFLDILSMDYRSKEATTETTERIEKLHQTWTKNSHYYMKLGDFASSASSSVNLPSPSSSPTSSSLLPSKLAAGGNETDEDPGSYQYQSSWFMQFSVILQRSFNEIMRNKLGALIKLCMAIFFALLFGSIYSDMSNNQKSIQDRVGILFMICINQAFGGVIGVVNTFPTEKKIIARERAGKAYRMSAYYLAKFVSESPVNIVAPIIFSTIIYYLAGLNPDPTAFLVFILLVCLLSFVAIVLGLIISALAPSFEAANALCPPVVIIFLLFGGFYINTESVPVGAQFMTTVSFFRWGFEALMINEFKGATFDCTAFEESSGVCIKTGEEVLARFSFDDHDTVIPSVIALFIWFAVGNVIAYTIIRLSAHKFLSMTQSDRKSADVVGVVVGKSEVNIERLKWVVNVSKDEGL